MQSGIFFDPEDAAEKVARKLDVKMHIYMPNLMRELKRIRGLVESVHFVKDELINNNDKK